MTEFANFNTYRMINTNRNTADSEYCDVDYLLRFWRAAKGEYLTKMFGDQLILERPIEYTRADSELREDMYNTLEDFRSMNNNLAYALRCAMGIDTNKTPYRADCVEDGVYFYLTNFLFNTDYLVNNTICLDDIFYDQRYHELHNYILKINDTKIDIQTGQKFTRVWGRIAKALDMEENWERFRIAHSQALNQRKLKGTLCLSIHPLDYATASDNDNGWSSCMSWQEGGCYRMGTVEMMNSPMVICAYLKSNKQKMEFNNGNEKYEWNSKKWRAWIIVTKEAIICNRHYPYHQPIFAKEAIAWTADLANRALGWNYEDIHEDFYTHMSEVNHEIDYATNYMYNDLGGEDVIGCLGEEFINSKKDYIHINFSGKAECMVCGEEIEPDVQDSGRLECNNCFHERECHSCGCEINEDESYLGADDEYYCSECFHERFEVCSECEEPIWNDEAIYFTMPISHRETENWLKKHHDKAEAVKSMFKDFWWNRLNIPSSVGGEYCVCPNCAKDYNAVELTIEDDDDYEDGVYIIPSPDYENVDRALMMCEARGFNSYRESRENIRDYWRDQWAYLRNRINEATATNSTSLVARNMFSGGFHTC